MRSFTLCLLTGCATAALLVGLALPARHVLRAPGGDSSAGGERSVAQAAHPDRVFGVYVDPWHADDWARAVGAAPQAIAKFEAFARDRGLREWATESRRRGIRRMLVSWEPWATVPVELGLRAQLEPQAGYRNADIARGVQDGYIRRFARSAAAFDGIVYLRYAHEMNGAWYPWSYDARGYRAAWRRIVRLFEEEGARNVRFVWSVNANLYEPARPWLRNLHLYWPGERYVDYVGATMIDFGGDKEYPVRRFLPRLRTLRERYAKPLVLTETNTKWQGRVGWLRDLRGMLQRTPWIHAVMWSQLPSRGNAHRHGDGLLDWDVQRDPAAAGELRQIILDGTP